VPHPGEYYRTLIFLTYVSHPGETHPGEKHRKFQVALQTSRDKYKYGNVLYEYVFLQVSFLRGTVKKKYREYFVKYFDNHEISYY